MKREKFFKEYAPRPDPSSPSRLVYFVARSVICGSGLVSTRVLRVATFCTRVQRRVVCCTENSFPHHVYFTPHPTPARKIFKLRIAQRHLGAIGNPSPFLRGLELDCESRATHICGASPPRSPRRALSRPSQLNGTKLSIRHVFALPLHGNSRFHCRITSHMHN